MIITRLWKNQPGKYFCISTKSATKKWNDVFFTKNELNEVEGFLERNNDKDIYFCPHGFDKERRLKPNAVAPKLFWADLDERDPRKIKIKPTIAFESSPGRYVGLWVVDRPVTEELNRRLNYFIGSDKSGWDFTQVLRMPGTVNYKYHSAPRVRILWSDGPEYTVSELEKRVPPERVVELDAGQESDAAAVFKKYERKLPAWCRRELVAGKPTPGKRSEMLWKLEQTLIEKGLSTGEAFVLIKSSPWNKFRGRRNEDEQLKRELEKAINHHFKASKPIEEDDEANGHRLLFRSMDEIEEENIDWIYYPYLARGELTILEGDPGLGKSYLMQMICSSICDGKSLPSVKHMKPVKGRIVYFDVENSSGTVTKKRLVDNGLENFKDFIQVEEPFSIDDEDALDEIYEYFDKHRPVIAVFDTINTYIGGADAFKSHEVQQTLINFKEIAKRFNCAVVVLRHLTKSSKERALYRGQGSIAFTGMARVVITVGQMPEEEDLRAMAVTKINVAPCPRALTFTINALPDTLKRQNRSKFEWGEFVDTTTEELVNVNHNAVTGEKKAAIEFLQDVLDEGEMELKRIEKMAEARSINQRTLRRAADEIGVKRRVTGFGSNRIAYWRLAGDRRDESRSRGINARPSSNRAPRGRERERPRDEDRNQGRRLH